MPFDFPAAPAIGDLYEPLGGPPYTWDGVAWMAQATGGATGDFVLKTGDMMTGPLVLPPVAPTQVAEAAHKTYVDENTLYRGVWQPGPNIPDLTPATVNAMPGYSWIASTADPAIQETPPAGLPGLSGLAISNADAIVWDVAGATYKVIRPPLTPAAGTIGDVKSAFLTADHNGWIKLDDRAITTLTPSQQTAAATLGFTSKLPLAYMVVPMQTGGAMGAIAGSNTRAISVANLPAHNMTSASVDTAVATTSSGPALDTAIRGTVRGKSATGGTGYYFLDAEGGNVQSIAHTHTVDIPNHSHTVALGGSGTPFDFTPKSMSVWYFVFLGL